MKRFLVTCSIALIATNLQAQTKDAKWNVGIVAGITQYKGSLGNNFYKFNSQMNVVTGASVTRYISEQIDVNLLVARGGLGINKNNTHFVNYFSTALLSVRLYLLNRNAVVKPYLMVGAGTLFYDKNSNIKSDIINIMAPSYGGGVNINLSSSVRLNFQEGFHHTKADKIDIDIPNEKATFLFHTIGVSLDLPSKSRK
ncbi:outer membrane beta-barrel protein [Parasediminibacterium paludis]|uniref:Outer membrane beta-barrel protein n=1 Tax=Parasediminibacterium paludis TaxID=908966 RepID=A0ABV8PVB7_9BACT